MMKEIPIKNSPALKSPQIQGGFCTGNKLIRKSIAFTKTYWIYYNGFSMELQDILIYYHNGRSFI